MIAVSRGVDTIWPGWLDATTFELSEESIEGLLDDTFQRAVDQDLCDIQDLSSNERKVFGDRLRFFVAGLGASIRREAGKAGQESPLLRAENDDDGRPVLWLDARLLNFLNEEVIGIREERSGLSPRIIGFLDDFLRRLREEAEERWSAWGEITMTPCSTDPRLFRLWDAATVGQGTGPWARILAFVAWISDAAPRVASLRRQAPALPVVVVESLAPSLHSLRVEDGRLVTSQKEPGLSLVPSIDGEVLEDIERKTHLLGSLDAHRLLRWMPQEGARRKALGEPEPDRVDIQGGYRGLVEVIGAMPGRSEMHVRDLVRLLRRITVRWQAADRTGELPLLVGFDDRTAVETRHRSAVLTLWLSPLMIPGKVVLPKGWRTLVPVLDLPALGAVSRNLWAAAGRLDLLALIRLAKRSPELVTHGGVHLDWESLAVEAGLNPARLPPLLDYWRHDGDDHEARWVIVGDDRWTLADRSSTRSAIRFLLEGARDRIRGREAGVASAIRKKALLKR